VVSGDPTPSPEEDKDIPGFYEMFVFDPDGFRVEVAYGPPELDPLRQDHV
jgi:hypothetical protein